jgi:hypothetical protein
MIAKTENNNGNGSCNDGSQIYLTKEQIIEDVVKDHGETPTKDNVMYLAGLVHKKKDTYSLYEAAADIKKKYNLDVKPSKEASDKLTADLKSSDGVLPEIERQFKEKYDDVDFENLYGRMQGFRHKHKGNNGKLKPIDGTDKLTFSFVSADDGKEWQNNEGPVKAMLEVMIKHDNNGGDTA